MRCVWLLLIFGVPLVSAAVHSHRYIYTATSGITGFPEFVIVGMVDGEQVNYYDSDKKEMIPRQEWVKGAVDSEFWTRNAQIAEGTRQVYKNNVEVLMQRFNQTGGAHTLQLMYGCELDDDGTTQGYFQYGYDGADFIALDKNTLTWTASNPQAVISKNKLEATGAEAQQQKNYLENTCTEWVKKYMNYGRETLERKVSPEVSLLQRDSSSPVECHATGFYPRQVMISWQKNGQDLSDDVNLRQTVPNGDGTFQKSSVLSVKSEEWKNNPDVYTCVVQHGGKDVIVSLNVENIKTNSGSNNMPIIIGCVVALVLVLVAVVIALIIRKRSKNGFVKTNTSDTDSENSDRPKA